ncbi:ribose-phosphate pyrophosphokinase [Candidatus Woesearchaeota archaeon]|nr:MAG: ribose-phosphate pyrophosphokinase [Candidatus Woesearchaeota archaeon]
MSERGALGIIACLAGEPLAQKINQTLLDKLGWAVQDTTFLRTINETHFPNTEVKVEIQESIRGQDIYVIQDCENSCCGWEIKPPNEDERAYSRKKVITDVSKQPADHFIKFSVDENLRALTTAIDAAKRADANYVTAVLPAFPYARQDKAISREGITAEKVAKEIMNSGADRVITLDIHNRAIAGFFGSIPVENLYASRTLIDHIRTLSLDNLVVVAPDAGGMPRAQHYAQRLEVPLANIYKQRDYSSASVVEQMRLNGDVKDKNVLIIDDMIATGGTLIKALQTLKDNGAQDTYFASSLPLLTPPAIRRISEAYQQGLLKKVITTDAVYHADLAQRKEWLEEVSIAPYIAKVIYHINARRSISELLE